MSGSIKITRTLFVGLGGTGVKAILRAKQCFMDAYGEIPPMVGFLAIDTDKSIKNQKLTSRKGEDVQLGSTEICFCPIQGNPTDIYTQNLSQFSWLPKKNTAFLQRLKNEGAGQIRTNGRFLARYNATTISEHLTSKVTEIGAPLPLDCRFTYDVDSFGLQYPTNINIVGSIAGGTGAGLMIDVINLASMTMKSTGLAYRIFPWMVLPDVFRHMAPGVASQNVYANAYGVLREMDYLYHMPLDNHNPLNFGFASINHLDGAVYRTAVFNNKNKAGIIFQNIDEITDAIGRCMFLPANGVDGKSVEDNLEAASFAYNVGNKEAHYSSAGCAELVYDNQAVGNVIARAIIADLCHSLCEKSNGLNPKQDAFNWASSQAVGIEEHEMDLLTDSLLSKTSPATIAIDKNSDAGYIINTIESLSGGSFVEDELKKNFESKKRNVTALLQAELENILSKPNGVGNAKAFLEELLIDIARSKDEMASERNELLRKISINKDTTDWNILINNTKGFLGRIKEDEAYALSQMIGDQVEVKRDELRHHRAIQFYTDIENVINDHLAKINRLSQKLKSIADKQWQVIKTIQGKAQSNSNFQIYLHQTDVISYSRPNESALFSAYCASHNINNLIEKSESDIENDMWEFAKVQPSVNNAVNVTIEDKLKQMADDNEQKVIDLFNRLKNMASPMWNTNPMGYVTTASPLSSIFAIGCYDAINGILQERFRHVFKIGAQNASFVTTRQTDRIMLYRIECYSPVYAINNLAGYKREAEEALERAAYPVFYIDEQWHQRMNVENFDVYPKQQGDSVLPNWVNAIVYGYVKYDSENNTYYMESDKGDVLRGGYLALGQRRDVAFDAFQNMELHKEVEQHLNERIVENGRPNVEAVMKSVKNNKSKYVSEHANLSPIELDAVTRKDPAYHMVIDLLIKEMNYINALKF